MEPNVVDFEALIREKRPSVSDAFFCGDGILPKRYVNKDLSNFDGNDEAVATAVTAIRKGESVTIIGPCGTGKTHLAVALLKEWGRNFLPVSAFRGGSVSVRYGMPTRWMMSSAEYLTSVRSSFSGGGPEEIAIGQVARIPMLILDDLASEKATDWTRSALLTLINHRYNELLPTVVTSNFGLQWIAENLDDRIASRLSEMGVIVKLDGKDRRVK